jgi:uncharacterized protein (DUF1800 family)
MLLLEGSPMADRIDPRWAWAPYEPGPKSLWDLAKVGHLYRRAAFGATWAELQAGVKDGPAPTIDKLLKGADTAAFDRDMKPLADSIAKANNGVQARAWWLYRMLYTPHPLQEKMTLFWHNHFATSNSKVNNASAMLGQYELMRQHALGTFGPLLQEMSKDPAMMVWLDTVQSTKAMPNENYARELMELFSLGIGHYTEKDIREAARAFTGWKITDGKAKFDAAQHDDTEKTVLGQTGRFQGSDIVKICLDQPACAPFIVGKLFRFLVSESLPATPELLEPLVKQYRDGYDTSQLVATVLRSNLFFSLQAYRSRIKSPIDFVLGMVRALEGRVGTTGLATALEGLGQLPFYPPSVKGWDGGPTWLNGQTLLYRQNLALALTSTDDTRFGRRCDPVTLAAKHGKASDPEVLEFFLGLFLQNDAPAEAKQRLGHYLEQSHGVILRSYWTPQDAEQYRTRAVCHLVLTLPEYQLD